MFFINFLKKQPPGRLIAMGFAAVILVGALLLVLPVSVWPDAQVSFVDALFTSTSAVCVTGLIAIDVADHFTPFGQAVVAVLIQIGGLGVTSVGVGLILAAGKRPGKASCQGSPERGQLPGDRQAGARGPVHDTVF